MIGVADCMIFMISPICRLREDVLYGNGSVKG